MVNFSALITIISTIILPGLNKAQGVSKDLYRCRQICYTKFVQDWHHCMDYEQCRNMCITPPNINNYIPEAFSFLCWNKCDETLGPFPLSVTSASRQGSLVLTDIAWDQAVTNASKQCLVTWEVSGGGLMGNLLTDSSTVELSLWPDTVYHVQVTCKNKDTGSMRQSFKLIVDTRKLSGTSSTIQPTGFDSNTRSVQNLFPTEIVPSDASEDRLKILKDSSKDKDVQSILDASTTSSSSSSFSDSMQTSHLSSSSSSPSESSASEDNRYEKTTTSIHIPSVIRSKLLPYSGGMESSEIITRSIVFAMVGSLALFLTILVIYLAFTRRREEKIVTDKQQLINNEILPGQTRTLHV